MGLIRNAVTQGLLVAPDGDVDAYLDRLMEEDRNEVQTVDLSFDDDGQALYWSSLSWTNVYDVVKGDLKEASRRRVLFEYAHTPPQPGQQPSGKSLFHREGPTKGRK